ncbi:MAG: efflux RND transporter permease subunit [Calditrichaeota bacterium]|nr:efflux RND transporter permease subunit [Calditrichota bacterium]
MRRFLNWWLDRPVSFLIFTGIFILIGILSLFNIPLELSPDVDFPQVTISVYYPDSSPEIIEALITAPIESHIQELSDIKKIESISSNNISRVTLHFDRKADMDFNIFRINEILSAYKSWLPKGVFRPSVQKFIPKEFKEESFLSYRLLTNLPEEELYRMVTDKIKRRLLNVPGVSSVELFGLRTPQVEVFLNLTKMHKYGVTLNDIRNKLSGSRVQVGFLKPGDYVLPVILDFSFKSIEELKNIPFKISNRRIIKLSDLSVIKQGYQKLRFKKRINGKHTILISIEKESGSNTISVANRVYRVIRKIEKDLPAGNQLILVNDASRPVRRAINDLISRTLFALIAMFVLLYIVLKRLYFTFVIILSIVLAVLTVFILIKFMGYSINLLTLAGLALGLGFIVDNSILSFDAIEPFRDKKQIIEHTSKIIFPIFASMLTTLAALLPFIFLSGKMRIYYISFAFVVAIALIASVIFSFTFIPASYWQIIKRIKKPHNKNLISNNIIKRVYQKFLLKILRWKKLILILSVLAFGIPLWLLPQTLEEKTNNKWSEYPIKIYNGTIGSPFYQKAREYIDPLFGGATYLFFKYVQRGEPWRWWRGNILSVYIRMPQGSDLGISEKIILEFEKIVLSQQGIEKTETTISPSSAYLSVSFKKEYDYSYLPYYLKELLIQRATKVGGVYISVSGYGDPYASGFYGSVSPFRIKLTGYNYNELKNIALRLQNELEKNVRIRNVDINAPIGFRFEPLYDLQMNINRRKLANIGLKPVDVIPLIRLYTTETLTGERIKLGNEEKYLSIKSVYSDGLQLDSFKNMWLQAANRAPFRINQFSVTRKQPVMSEIHRENQEYIRMLSFDYLGPYNFGEQYLDNVLKDFKIPIGYKIFPLHWRRKTEGSNDLLFIILLGLVFIYMVTASLYESFLDPLIIFLTIPAGLIGIFVIFYLTDTIFNKSAYVGVLFISGIVVNNSIILVSKYQNLLNESKNLIRSIVKGSVQHLRPIFLTTFTTILGFLPMIVLADKKANDLWFTLALTGIGGMISSLLFVLFVLPVLYFLLHKRKL